MRILLVALGLAVALVAGAAVYAALSSTSGEQTVTLAPASRTAFDGRGRIEPGPSEGEFSPDGSQVLVVDRGTVQLARRGALRAVTPAGGSIVEAAWMPSGAALLVAEGPIPTGELTAIDLSGKSIGTTKLQPSIGFDAGYGMDVDRQGQRAAVIEVDRDAIGGHIHTDLAVVDLASGQVQRYASPAADESGPRFVDDGHAAVRERDARGGTNVAVIDLSSGHRTSLGAATSAPLGVTRDGAVVFTRRGATTSKRGDDVVAVDPVTRAATRLGSLPAGSRAVSIDPLARRVLIVATVAVDDGSADAGPVDQLRAFDLPARSNSATTVAG